MTIKIEVEVWGMKQGKNTILKDADGNLFYSRLKGTHVYPREHKPAYYFKFIKWMKDKKQFTLEDFKKDYPKAPLGKLKQIASILIKENKIQQRDDIKKGLLEVIE